MRQSRTKLACVLTSAIVFGAIWALAKSAGGGGGVQLYVGNLSAPWLVLPLLGGIAVASAGQRSIRQAVGVAMAGGCTALVSLLSFYVTVAFVFDAVNAHTLRNNLFFIVGGTLGAALFTGVVVTLSAGRRKVALLLLAAAFIAEPFFSLGYATYQRTMNRDVVAVAVVELALGIVLAFAINARPRGRQA